MSQSKHTPLPWRTYADPKTGNQDTTMVFSDEIGANGGNTIARFFGADQQANAALFMAAPDLLETLKGLLSQVGDSYTMRREIEAAREVIDKAEGKST